MTNVKSSKTVFSALGFETEQSENLRLRAALMIEIEAVLKQRKLTQVAAAKLFGASQPRVNNLLKGRIDKFTVDTLVNWLNKLDKHIELVVSDSA
jgi:predicted XRE-type DNA-binding protein